MAWAFLEGEILFEIADEPLKGILLVRSQFKLLAEIIGEVLRNRDFGKIPSPEQIADWIFEGFFEDEVEFMGKMLKMRSLSSEEAITASQAARGQVGDDQDRDFLTNLETLSYSIIEVGGKPVERGPMKRALLSTPATLVRHLYNLYYEKIVTAVQKEIEEPVKN